MMGNHSSKAERPDRPGDFGGTDFIDEADSFWLSDAACSVRHLSDLAIDKTAQIASAGDKTEE